MSTEAVALPAKTSLLQSRWGSFLAVVPLSVWTVNHLWDNLSAYRGAQAWEEAVTAQPHPVAQVLTLLVVLLPLLMHTFWGIARLFSARPNNVAYRNYDNFKYLLQRLSAVGVLLFLGAHIWLAFLHPHLVEGHAEPFEDIAREMHFHGPTLMVYLLGTLGVSYHLANGLLGFAMGWGLITTERSLRRFEPVVIGLFLLLLVMSWSAIYALYQAGAAFGPMAG